MSETTIYREGQVARIETRTTRKGANMACLWIRLDGLDEMQPLVVFPPEYEPLAATVGVGSRIWVEGSCGVGEYTEVIYADHIGVAKLPVNRGPSQ